MERRGNMLAKRKFGACLSYAYTTVVLAAWMLSFPIAVPNPLKKNLEEVWGWG